MLSFNAKVHVHPMYALLPRFALPLDRHPFEADTYALELLPKLSNLTTHAKIKVLTTGEELVEEIPLMQIPTIEVNEALLPPEYKVADLLDYLHAHHGYVLPAGLAAEWTNSFGTITPRRLDQVTPDWALCGPIGSERYYYELGIKDHRSYGFLQDCILFTKPRD